jgi:hypothetical protein
MKVKTSIILILLVSIGFLQCRKNDIDRLNCELFRQGLIEKDNQKTAQALGPLLSYYSLAEFEKLTSAISTFCDVRITGKCFSCYYSLPPASSIGLSLTAGGSSYVRGLIISQDSHGRMGVYVD